VEIRGDRPWEPHIDRALTVIPAFALPDSSPARRPRVRHGVIGSADRSLRSARVRDELAATHQLIAIEMEGKGIGGAGFASTFLAHTYAELVACPNIVSAGGRFPTGWSCR
jgi:nucleoside phosphorylase